MGDFLARKYPHKDVDKLRIQKFSPHREFHPRKSTVKKTPAAVNFSHRNFFSKTETLRIQFSKTLSYLNLT